MDLRQTRNWNFGRLGEYLQLAIYAHFGWGLLDTAGTTRNVPPMLRCFGNSITAPDAMGWRSGQLAFQFKTKEQHNPWRGGTIADDPRIPPRLEEGIDHRCWQSHLAFQELTRIPVLLSVLSLKEGELLAATLDGLGSPRYSPSGGYNLVNWDVRQFVRIARFDPELLRTFFYKPDGTYKLAPEDCFPADSMRKWLKLLQPEQAEFDVIHLVATRGSGQYAVVGTPGVVPAAYAISGIDDGTDRESCRKETT